MRRRECTAGHRGGNRLAATQYRRLRSRAFPGFATRLGLIRGSGASASFHSRVTTLPFSTVSARRPCLSSIARSPNNFRRQPRAPARRLVALGDRFEIVDRGDQLAGDAAVLAHLPQQHFEQFDGRADIDAIASLALDLRQCLGVALEPAFDRRQNFCAARDAPSRAERRGGWRAPQCCAERQAQVRSTLRPSAPRPGHVAACASLSRQAASSISIARSRGLRALSLYVPMRARDAARKSKASQRLHLVVEPGLTPGSRHPLRQG